MPGLFSPTLGPMPNRELPPQLTFLQSLTQPPQIPSTIDQMQQQMMRQSFIDKLSRAAQARQEQQVQQIAQPSFIDRLNEAQMNREVKGLQSKQKLADYYAQNWDKGSSPWEKNLPVDKQGVPLPLDKKKTEFLGLMEESRRRKMEFDKKKQQEEALRDQKLQLDRDEMDLRKEEARRKWAELTGEIPGPDTGDAVMNGIFAGAGLPVGRKLGPGKVEAAGERLRQGERRTDIYEAQGNRRLSLAEQAALDRNNQFRERMNVEREKYLSSQQKDEKTQKTHAMRTFTSRLERMADDVQREIGDTARDNNMPTQEKKDRLEMLQREHAEIARRLESVIIDSMPDDLRAEYRKLPTEAKKAEMIDFFRAGNR